MNQQWLAITDKFTVDSVQSYQLFDCTPEDLKIRRQKTPEIPRKILQKKKVLAECSEKELLNELKRRGKKYILK